MYRLGIDVGGTNTDAVILDDTLKVVASTKTHTTSDIESGIKSGIHEVVTGSGVDPTKIGQAMLGTTQATNAIVERRHLGRVGVLRIGYPATQAIVPYTEWPEDLVKALSGTYKLISGGYEFDGYPIAPFDEGSIRSTLESWRGKVDGIAIIGVFSSINDDQERRTAEIVHETLGKDFPVSLSCDIGSVGLVGRENATILNTALFTVIDKVTQGFSKALEREGITNSQEYLCQNDGTLMSLDFASRYPILTIGSGPTNSIRGAAYLSGLQNALVLDIGGTTSDIGALVNGFPRESSKSVDVGGVDTNFRMPDVLSVGLGGGSIVRVQDNGTVTVGPDSVGYAITEKAKVFGGDTLTATDIAVRMGLTELGDPSLVADIPQDEAEKAMSCIRKILEDGVDQMKTSAEDVELVLVGGGSIIAPGELAGVATVHTNPHGGVANAIGATIAQIGGEFEKMYQYASIPRKDALADASKQASERAVVAGADADTVQVVEVTETPLQYAPGETTKVKVKVVGDAKQH